MNTRVARPIVICSSVQHRRHTHAVTRAMRNGIGGGKPREKKGCRWSSAVEGAFHLVAFTQEATDVNALVFIASGSTCVYVCELPAWKSYAYACAYSYARVRRTPRCIGELPTVRGVHHPRLTGGTRSPLAPFKAAGSLRLFRSPPARSRAANPTRTPRRMFVDANDDNKRLHFT